MSGGVVHRLYSLAVVIGIAWAHSEDAAIRLISRYMPQLTPLQKTLKRLLTDFSAPDAASPEGLMQEVLSAVSMLFPIAHGYSLLRDLPSSAHCPTCGWTIFVACLAHMPFSIAYHIVCALNSRGRNIDDTIARCLDQSGIHLCCTVIAIVLSQSAAYATLVVPFNIWCVVLLWCRARTEERHCRFVRMGVAITMKLAALGYRADLCSSIGLCGCWLLGALVFIVDKSLLAGWGHMTMHLLIVLVAHIILKIAVQV